MQRWDSQAALRVTVRPEGEPLTLADAQQQTRVDLEGSPPVSAEDAFLLRAIATAREWVERRTGLSILPQELLYTLAALPPGRQPLVLPAGPVISVTALQVLGQPFTDFTIVRDDLRASLVPTSVWPSVSPRLGAVTVSFRAGFAEGSPETVAVPPLLQQAMLLLVDHQFVHRGAASTGMQEVPFGIESMVGSWCDWRL